MSPNPVFSSSSTATNPYYYSNQPPAEPAPVASFELIPYTQTITHPLTKSQKQPLRLEFMGLLVACAVCLFFVFGKSDAPGSERNRPRTTPAMPTLSHDESQFVRDFAPDVIEAADKYNLPATAIMAQCLVECNAGKGKLYRASGNFLGIKCWSKRCQKGHCINFSDDSHKDFFRVFTTRKACLASYCALISNSPRYQKATEESDAAAFIQAIARAGYATDKAYAATVCAKLPGIERAFQTLERGLPLTR